MKDMKDMNDMKPLGIYLHVPFCRHKCPYCDFYSVTVTEPLLDAYTDETARRIAALAGQGLCADTVYFGGGTPSLLGGERIRRLLEALRGSVAIQDGAEITVEANPSSDLAAFLTDCADAGVNRLSLGMQSALQKELSAIGRRHTPDDVLRAMEAAHRAGIENISLDLMLGIPFQTAESLDASLDFIAAAAPSHVSAYMLKIEENTPFHRIRYALPLADEDGQADLYELAFGRLDDMGYTQYEISNAARKGCESRHNLKYWNCGEYLAFGPSAHGFFRGKRYFHSRSLQDYLAGAAPTGDGAGGSPEEYVMLRLRLREGLTDSGMRERFGIPIPPAMRERAASPLLKDFCRCDESGISLTRKGMLVSNAIIGDLLGTM